MKAPTIERLALNGAAIVPATANADLRTVEVVFLSGAPIQRVDPWSGEPFDLYFDPEGADLTRLNSGAAPVLDSHQDRPLSAQIGTVERAWRAGKKFLAKLRFSEREDVAPIWRDVLAGVCRGVSGGFILHEVAETTAKDGTVTRTALRWGVVELSIVTVPADPGAVTLSMNMGEPTMTTSTATAGPAPVRTNHQAEVQAALEAANLGQTFNDALLATSPTLEQARNQIFAEMCRRSSQWVQPIGVSVTRDQGDTVRAGMLEALTARTNGTAPAEIGRPWHGRRMVEMARELLQMRGVRTFGGDSQIVTAAMQNTADFPNLLSGYANKALLDAYRAAESGLKLAFRRSTANDFKTQYRVRRGEFPALLKVNEGAQYTTGLVGESMESYSISTYGRIFSITRQAIINDDLNAFGDTASAIGSAAADYEATALVALLTSNSGAGPVMTDSYNLFDNTHHYNSGSGVIGVTALDAARTAMRTQKGIDATTIIDARPKFLICPAAKETTAQQVLSTITPALVSNVNPFAGALSLIAEPRLDAKSATRWYLCSDPSVLPAVEYAYLAGAEGPQIETQTGFEIDGLMVKCRLDFGCAAIDWRGIFISSGT